MLKRFGGPGALKKNFFSHTSKGFSLLEVLVALGVLMIGLSSVFALMAAATATHKKSIDETNSAFVAQGVIADVAGKLSLAKKLEDLQVKGQRMVGYPFYSYDVYLEPVDQEGFEILVAVSIYWDQGGKKHAKTYQTILLKGLVPLDHPEKLKK